jgi:catechol 2,3-dioxygenase-like lactoylglutathione lyase family enzyme
VIDHLVYATPDLDAAVEWVAATLGVRPTPGGRHPGLGTRNALLDLGAGAYLEIIGVDGEAGAAPDGPRPFGLDHLAGPRLAAWAAKADGIDRRVARARAAGYDPGPVQPLSRRLPDGTELRWRLTFPGPDAVELVPFLIEWADDTPHPSTTSAAGCRLVSFTGAHPEPDAVAPVLRALGVELAVQPAASAALMAVIEGPGGTVRYS